MARRKDRTPRQREVAAFISETLRARMTELGISQYRMVRENDDFNLVTMQRLLHGVGSPSVDTLVPYLDTLGLELSITKK
jgi:DNA-binding phage protein